MITKNTKNTTKRHHWNRKFHRKSIPKALPKLHTGAQMLPTMATRGPQRAPQEARINEKKCGIKVQSKSNTKNAVQNAKRPKTNKGTMQNKEPNLRNCGGHVGARPLHFYTFQGSVGAVVRAFQRNFFKFFCQLFAFFSRFLAHFSHKMHLKNMPRIASEMVPRAHRRPRGPHNSNTGQKEQKTINAEAISKCAACDNFFFFFALIFFFFNMLMIFKLFHEFAIATQILLCALDASNIGFFALNFEFFSSFWRYFLLLFPCLLRVLWTLSGRPLSQLPMISGRRCAILRWFQELF